MRNKKTIYWYTNCFLKVQRVGLKAKNSNIYSAITTFSFLLFSKSSLLIFMNPLSCCTSPPFIGTFPFTLSLVGLFPTRFKGYLSYHLSTLPSFHHEIGLLGVSLLFRLVFRHLMWKRLGREPLINAEVTASVVLIISWYFPNLRIMTFWKKNGTSYLWFLTYWP